MSRIPINCPHCGKHLLSDSQQIGKQVICPGCKQAFVVRNPADEMRIKEDDVAPAGGDAIAGGAADSSEQQSEPPGHASRRTQGGTCRICGRVVEAGVDLCSRCARRQIAHLPHAGFGRRAAAALIDQVIVGAAAYLITAPIVVLLFYILADDVRFFSGSLLAVPLAIRTASLFAIGEFFSQMPAEVRALVIFTFLCDIVIGWLYYAEMESSASKATVGKMALGIVVVDDSGRRLSFNKATGRFFGKFISVLTLNAGFVMAALTPNKQALHDMISSTYVIEKPRPVQQDDTQHKEGDEQ